MDIDGPLILMTHRYTTPVMAMSCRSPQGYLVELPGPTVIKMAPYMMLISMALPVLKAATGLSLPNLGPGVSTCTETASHCCADVLTPLFVTPL